MTLFFLAALAAAEPVPEPTRSPVRAELITTVEQVTPGEEFLAGVRLVIAPGWHVYYRNPGDTALATQIDWSVVGGSVGDLRWPAPSVFVDPTTELRTFGYADEVLLWVKTVVALQPGEAVELAADVHFLACGTDCLPGEIALMRTVPVGTVTVPGNQATQVLFDRAQQAAPRDGISWGYQAEWIVADQIIRPGEALTAALAISRCRGNECTPLQVDDAATAFVSDGPDGVRWSLRGVRPHPVRASGVVVDLMAKARENAPESEGSFQGIVRLSDAERGPVTLSFALRAPVARGRPTNPDLTELLRPADAPSPSRLPVAELRANPEDRNLTVPMSRPIAPPPWWVVILMALAGGMILNLMPCVLPVLALKAMGVVHLGAAERREAVVQSLGYAAGVVASMLVLAASVLLMRAAGTRVGWGFQFQDHRFLLVVGGILIAFALNLFGVFDVQTTSSGLDRVANRLSGVPRAALDGVLAVMLATPCSAPFLGTAVGFALASDGWVVVAIFALIGVGLAAPFVGLVWFPGLRRFLPRPGPWMKTLKEVLGFALLGTFVWITWVTGQVGGLEGMTRVLIFGFMVAAAAWLFGIAKPSATKPRRPVVLRSLALGLVVAGSVWLMRELPAEALDQPSATRSGASPWQPFGSEALATALAAGKPVFVDFTAEWCITCKVNERSVIEHPKVQAAFRDRDVTLLRADYTRRDAAVSAWLARFGRAGVPMYLVYDPRSPDDPTLLPETLTTDMVLRALPKDLRGIR